MDEMEKWMNEWMNQPINQLIHVLNEWIDGCMKGLINKWIKSILMKQRMSEHEHVTYNLRRYQDASQDMFLQTAKIKIIQNQFDDADQMILNVLSIAKIV